MGQKLLVSVVVTVRTQGEWSYGYKKYLIIAASSSSEGISLGRISGESLGTQKYIDVLYSLNSKVMLFQ